MLMGFCKIGRLVICMLLMVVLSSVNGQPVQISSSNADCPVEHLELQLTSIENRLNRMQEIISSMNNPFINESCTIDLASYGYNDSTISGYIRTSGGSSEQIYFPEKIDRYRGVTLVELDPKKCTTKNRQRFDTHASASDRLQLLETLESTSAGTIVVGVTADTPENEDNESFKEVVDLFFTKYNMSVWNIWFRDKFAFVMQKGYLTKTLFQRKARNGDSLRMKVGLRGSTVYDVTFIRL